MPDLPLHVVTIMNFPPDANVRRMEYAFLDSVIAGGAERVTVLYEFHEPFIPARHRQAAEIVVRQGRSFDLGHPHFNLRFKLANLAALDEPFLFLDVDTFVLGDLRELWALRGVKPWIGIDHQWVPGDARTHRSPFLNSGLQLVSDPTFYDLNAILAVQNAVVPLHRHSSVPKSAMFPCPGHDQAVLFRYFRTIGYDYTHPRIGPAWNSCAGMTTVAGTDGRWTARADGYDVRLIHYWSQFKPWAIDCPIYRSYEWVEPMPPRA
ncbi:MAG TPA: hypothetical protein VGJ05_04525 [Fimbriiglobus sp.]